MIDQNDHSTAQLPLHAGPDMVQIPPNAPFDPMAALSQWYMLKDQLSSIKAQEMALRKQLFTHFFPNPKEGTNKFELPDDYQLKGGYTLDRKVDEAAYKANLERFREGGFNPDELVKWEPSLSKSKYNELTDEQQQLFDQCLVVKPGPPTLEIVKPKAKAKAGATQENAQ